MFCILYGVMCRVEYTEVKESIEKHLLLPESIVALYHMRNSENGKNYLDRALFVK